MFSTVCHFNHYNKSRFSFKNNHSVLFSYLSQFVSEELGTATVLMAHLASLVTCNLQEPESHYVAYFPYFTPTQFEHQPQSPRVSTKNDKTVVASQACYKRIKPSPVLASHFYFRRKVRTYA